MASSRAWSHNFSFRSIKTSFVVAKQSTSLHYLSSSSSVFFYLYDKLPSIMKINVALFITALSTTSSGRHGVMPVVSAAAAGDDGAAAAATTTVDRPHLRALLQETPLEPARACPKFIGQLYGDQTTASNSCANTPDYCLGCDSQYSSCFQESVVDGDVAYNKKGCCSTSNNDNNCFGKNEEEDSMFIKADEDEEEEVPQDTTTAEDFLEVAGCPAAGFQAEACPAGHCDDCNGKPRCESRHYACESDLCSLERNYNRCCNSNGNNCNGSFPDEEDAVMIKADEEEEEVPQDTDKLDASSPLRASLLKVE